MRFFDMPQLASSDSLSMLTASLNRNRLLVDFRNYGFARNDTVADRGMLLLSGEYGVEVGGHEFSVFPYHVRSLFDGGIGSPFYFRVPCGASAVMTGSGIYQHVTTHGGVFRNIAGARPVGRLKMIRTSEEAFHTTDPIVTVGHPEIDVLKTELPNTARKRIRLCCHENSEADLHEMFVLYTKQTYIQPNKHLAKDETFLILEGEADFIFYSDAGDVTKIIPLGPPESGKTFFVQVPQGRYHSVVMSSDYLVIHESTPGPYDREHTVWAPWAKSQKLS